MHEGHRVARKFFAGTSTSYDAVVKITTFGRDTAWKREILDLIPQGNYKVLDLACGTGILTFAIASKVSAVVGVDLMEESIRIANEKARRYNIENISFCTSAAETVPQQDSSFDFVTASYLPKYCDVDIVVKESARLLRRNGVLIMHDFTYPRSTAMRGLWNAYFAILGIAGMFTPSWKPVFNELDRVIKESRWVEELMHAMNRYGFRNLRHKSLTCDTSAIVWGIRR
jgi:demethylmenaquinone methyltransferase/2-methoxy-6-polyprenyl-1,4-benzoquinol methylase